MEVCGYPGYLATQPMICFCSQSNVPSMEEAMEGDSIYVKPLDSCPFIYLQLFGFLVSDPDFCKLQICVCRGRQLPLYYNIFTITSLLMHPYFATPLGETVQRGGEPGRTAQGTLQPFPVAPGNPQFHACIIRSLMACSFTGN